MQPASHRPRRHQDSISCAAGASATPISRAAVDPRDRRCYFFHRPQFRHRLQGRHADRGAEPRRRRPISRTMRATARRARPRRGAGAGVRRADDVLIRVAAQPGGDAAQQAVVDKVRGALGDATTTIAASRWSARACRANCWPTARSALVLAIVGILVYIWFRFEWQFALGAMIANVHDVVLTIGFFVAHPDRLRPDQHRGAPDDHRLFAERHRRHLRPHPRDAAPLQEDADCRSCSTSRSTRRCRARSSRTSTVTLGAARAVLVRRPRRSAASPPP